MGLCWCKEKHEDNTYVHTPPVISNQTVSPSSGHISPTSSHYCMKGGKAPDPAMVNKLVLETLGVIATLVDNEQEPPASLLLIHNIADNEEGWIQVVISMINVVPLEHPLGPSVITLLIDDCPLPSKESVFMLMSILNLSRESAFLGRSNIAKERNTCVVLGCIAEKLAGPRNLEILSNNIVDYLFVHLAPDSNPSITLFALIALEKFAQTKHNKTMIVKRLEESNYNVLLSLETWYKEKQYIKRQVGFCAQWVLDNLFVKKNRTYSYLTTKMNAINAMLNTKDVSEYLKISPDGLEARCDAYSFESVRCTAQAHSGIWYYEVLIITPGVMQIGWATKDSNFLNHEGYGIGDDKYSVAYDGCRRLIWYNAKSELQNLPAWQPGDILGCLLDIDNELITFSVNGVSLPGNSLVFTEVKTGFFAAASFMSFQQCRFNFGSEHFRHPPNINYDTFNGCGVLKPEDKIVVPRHILFQQLKQQNIQEDSCTLCYDQKASVRLIPCEHSGFCVSCAHQLLECPMCRSPFQLVLEENL